MGLRLDAFRGRNFLDTITLARAPSGHAEGMGSTEPTGGTIERRSLPQSCVSAIGECTLALMSPHHRRIAKGTRVVVHYLFIVS
jgi:hypothetical protein